MSVKYTNAIKKKKNSYYSTSDKQNKLSIWNIFQKTYNRLEMNAGLLNLKGHSWDVKI